MTIITFWEHPQAEKTGGKYGIADKFKHLANRQESMSCKISNFKLKILDFRWKINLKSKSENA